MDVNDIRNGVTLLSFLIFGGILKWALSRRNQARFDEAELLPFLDGPDVTAPQTGPPAGDPT
jgi:cytochrome c oxidase cbb3-type subunit 4